MKSVVASSVVVQIFLVVALRTVSGENCTQFKLTEQPPQTLGCNPYYNTGTEHVWRLRSSCTIMRVGDIEQFQLHWFHRTNDSRTVIDMGWPEFQTSTPTAARVLFGNNLTNQPFNDSMLGEYWCQIIAVQANKTFYYGSSNTITIQPPGYYNNELAVCSGTITVSSTVCADSPILMTSPQSDMGNTPTQTNAISTVDLARTPTSIIPTSTMIRFTMNSYSSTVMATPIPTQHTYVTKAGAGDSNEGSGDIPLGMLLGIIMAILMLILASILMVCMIIMITTSLKKHRAGTLERIPLNNMKRVIDPSVMTKNPSYKKVKIVQETNHRKDDYEIATPTTSTPTQPLSSIHNNTIEPLYMNATDLHGNARYTITKRPHYENIELCRPHDSCRGNGGVTNQITAAGTHQAQYTKNSTSVHLNQDHCSHEYANITTRQSKEHSPEGKYANIPIVTLPQGQRSDDNHQKEDSGSTKTLKMKEVL